jgi:hypothetical protein
MLISKARLSARFHRLLAIPEMAKYLGPCPGSATSESTASGAPESNVANLTFFGRGIPLNIERQK